MSTIPVQRLDERARGALLAHFVALTPEDRRLRFGSSLSAEGIAGYVDGIDFDRDVVFAVHDDSSRACRGCAPCPRRRPCRARTFGAPRPAAVAASAARCSSAARSTRATVWCRTLFMHCLRENAAIVHIAQKRGMHIVTESGDADAHLELLPAFAGSIAGELKADRVALCDYALKAQVAARKGVIRASSRRTATPVKMRLPALAT